MKSHIYIFSFGALLVAGCNPTPSTPVCPSGTANIIQYHNPEPDLHASSASTLSLNTLADMPCYYPANNDSVAYINLDVDGDSANDFRFSVSHNVSWTGWTPASQCEHYFYGIAVESLVPGDRVMAEMVNESEYADFLDSNEIIGITGNFSTSDNCFIHKHFPITFTSWYNHWIPGSTYIGYKINRNNNTYYGWIQINGQNHELFIQSWAFNTIPGNCVQAGEQ
jgi:hypothetical protein